MNVEHLLNELYQWRARAYRAEAERDEANLRAASEARRADDYECAYAELVEACTAIEHEAAREEIHSGIDRPVEVAHANIVNKTIAA